MAFDVVFPGKYVCSSSGNDADRDGCRKDEADFMVSAKRQGFSLIVFAYHYHDRTTFQNICADASSRISKLEISSTISYKFAAILSKRNFNDVQSLKEKGYLTFFDAAEDFLGKRFERDDMDKYLRMIASSKHVDGLFGIERVSTKKGLHYRNGGMSHINAKMMQENNIFLLEDWNALLPANSKKANLPGILQNAKLSRKYSFPMSFFSFAGDPSGMSSAENMKSVSRQFGIPTKWQSETTLFPKLS